MSGDIKAYYDDSNHIVVVFNEIEGIVTTENVKYASGLAIKTAGEHKCANLLFDITMMREGQSIEKGFLAMNNVSKTTGLTLEHKCAVVYDPQRYSQKRADLIQMVVRYRPNPPFKMFTSREKAIKWLKDPVENL